MSVSVPTSLVGQVTMCAKPYRVLAPAEAQEGPPPATGVALTAASPHLPGQPCQTQALRSEALSNNMSLSVENIDL